LLLRKDQIGERQPFIDLYKPTLSTNRSTLFCLLELSSGDSLAPYLAQYVAWGDLHTRLVTPQ